MTDSANLQIAVPNWSGMLGENTHSERVADGGNYSEHRCKQSMYFEARWGEDLESNL
jgi:hypothetical protein